MVLLCCVGVQVVPGGTEVEDHALECDDRIVADCDRDAMRQRQKRTFASAHR
jgi:hypothetical protein